MCYEELRIGKVISRGPDRWSFLVEQPRGDVVVFAPLIANFPLTAPTPARGPPSASAPSVHPHSIRPLYTLFFTQ